MITALEPDVVPKAWYNIASVSQLLGLSRSYIYMYMKQGTLKFRWTEDGKHRIVSGQEIRRFWKSKVVR